MISDGLIANDQSVYTKLFIEFISSHIITRDKIRSTRADYTVWCNGNGFLVL